MLELTFGMHFKSNFFIIFLGKHFKPLGLKQRLNHIVSNLLHFDHELFDTQMVSYI